MAEMTDEDQARYESNMGQAIGKGILIGLPLAYVVITLALFVFTDRTLGSSAATAAIPGVLLGVFGGGFAGVAATMD